MSRFIKQKFNNQQVEIEFDSSQNDEDIFASSIDENATEKTNLYSDLDEIDDESIQIDSYDYFENDDPTLSEFFIEKPVAKLNQRVNKGIISLPFQCAKIIQNFDKNNRKLNKNNSSFDLKNLWKEIVDEQIASITFPLKITDKGVLYISILNSSVASLVSHLSDEILEKVNSFFGSDIVKKIKIQSVIS